MLPLGSPKHMVPLGFGIRTRWGFSSLIHRENLPPARSTSPRAAQPPFTRKVSRLPLSWLGSLWPYNSAPCRPLRASPGSARGALYGDGKECTSWGQVLLASAHPSPGDLPNPGIEPRSPALRADAFCLSHPGLPHAGRRFTD